MSFRITENVVEVIENGNATSVGMLGSGVDVVNNLTTTEIGHVLDARQGKQLNDKITTVSGNVTKLGQDLTKLNSRADYYKLHGSGDAGLSVSTAAQTYNTFNSRKFSDYTLLVFALTQNNLVRATIIVPYMVFYTFKKVELSYVDSANVQRCVDVELVSDTSFKVSASSNVAVNTYVAVSGVL